MSTQTLKADCKITMRNTSGSTRFLRKLLSVHALWRQRRDLARLDRARLNDIGISPADAQNEARRALWDAPDGWLK